MTQLWVAVFAFMILDAIVLAVFASTETWSWVTHIGNYLLVVIVMLLEFVVRKYYFRDDTPDFKTFVSALSRHKWK